MKRITAWMLAGLLCIAMTGCQQKSQDVKNAEVMIKAIKTVTIDSGEDIARAQRFFDGLSEEEKTQVSNYEDLLAAVAAYDRLVLCGEWVRFTEDGSSLTLREDGSFTMSDGIGGTYEVSDGAVALRINGSGEPILLTMEKKNNLMHLKGSLQDYIRPDLLTVEDKTVTDNNWDRWFLGQFHLHKTVSDGVLTELWDSWVLLANEAYDGLIAPGTELTVTVEYTEREVRTLYDVSSDEVLLVEELTAPAVKTAQVKLTADSFAAADGCCQTLGELVRCESRQYENTAFDVLPLAENLTITGMTGTVCYYNQLVD